MKEAKVTPKFKVGDVLERYDENPYYHSTGRVVEITADISWTSELDPKIVIRCRFEGHAVGFRETQLTLVKEGGPNDPT